MKDKKIKCPYCDFNHPGNCGLDFYSDEEIHFSKIMNNVDGLEYQFLQLYASDKYPTLRFIHSDNERYSMEDDDVCFCHYCPMCGRYLGKTHIEATYANNEVLREFDRTRR